MSNIFNDMPKELKMKITIMNKHIKEECAEKIAKDLKEMYNSVIKDFYQDYKNPRSYKRTYTAYETNNYSSNKENYKHITTIHDNGITVKFKVGTNFIDYDPYRADTEWVFTRTYKHGIHGWTPEEAEEYYNNSWDSNYGYYDANGQFHISTPLALLSAIPKPLDPPPEERMQKKYEKYKLPFNLKKVCDPIVERNRKKYLK